MSSGRVPCPHDPRSCFTLPPKKRMRTQVPATKADRLPPQLMMNQFPLMPLNQQIAAQMKVASRPSYFPALPVPQFPATNTARLQPPLMNQIPLMPLNQQDAAEVKVASRPSYFSALPVRPGQAVVVNPIRPHRVPKPQFVMQGHANATKSVVWPTSGNLTPPGPVMSNPIPSKSLMNPQNGDLPLQFPVQPPSQAQQTPTQDASVGLELDHAKLKARHESVIKSLYADLPRQCATCGMRFKTKEGHSHHMDWHVRKNRDAKNSKQKKQMLSQKYFLTSKLWLTAAKAIGTYIGPAFFDNIEDEKEHEKSCDVPADESQKECPLCMEPFDEYFSNDTNDWMYKEAVCFNPAKNPKRNLYRSLIGRIVHGKCVSIEEDLNSF